MSKDSSNVPNLKEEYDGPLLGNAYGYPYNTLSSNKPAETAPAATETPEERNARIGQAHLRRLQSYGEEGIYGPKI